MLTQLSKEPKNIFYQPSVLEKIRYNQALFEQRTTKQKLLDFFEENNIFKLK